MPDNSTRNSLPIILTLVCSLLLAGCGAYFNVVVFAPLQKPMNMIYDDDCDGDYDCAITQPIIHYWIDMGYVKMWGMVSSGPSQLGAPTMKVFQHYYGHDGLFSIGAWTPNCGFYQSAAWNVAVVSEFDAGDVCTNYMNCATVLRQSVANYIAGGGKANGITYVITGPLSCEEEFRATSADSISHLTGVQMEQQFIKEFVLMNGVAPSGVETNCMENAYACSAFFSNVTSNNGYPPVYAVPYNTGASTVITKIPVASLPMTNPTAYALNSIDRTSSADEDALAVEYAVFGNTGWILSSNSTNMVNARTGENSWSDSTASGQYYLTVSISLIYFESILTPPWLPFNVF